MPVLNLETFQFFSMKEVFHVCSCFKIDSDLKPKGKITVGLQPRTWGGLGCYAILPPFNANLMLELSIQSNFIYIARLTMDIVTKQLHRNPDVLRGSSVWTSVVHFLFRSPFKFNVICDSPWWRKSRRSGPGSRGLHRWSWQWTTPRNRVDAPACSPRLSQLLCHHPEERSVEPWSSAYCSISRLSALFQSLHSSDSMFYGGG